MANRDASIEREFREFWHASFDRVTKDHDVPLVFEHGSADGTGGGGTCVFHAHIHFIPVQAPVDAALHAFGRIREMPEGETWVTISDVGTSDYLAYLGQDGARRFVTPLERPPPCQFIRRFLGHHIGLADWNWKAALALSVSVPTPPPSNSSDERQS